MMWWFLWGVVWLVTWRMGYLMLTASWLWIFPTVSRSERKMNVALSGIPVAGFLAATFVYVMERPPRSTRGEEVVYTRETWEARRRRI